MIQKHLIFADYFTSLHTREISGQSWSWRYYHGDKVQWSGDLYETVDASRKSIAAPYYPLIGPYDTLNPDVLEYHILLAKTAGIDGFLCEYDTHHSLDHKVVLLMAQIAQKHDFKIGIHWIPINFTNRTPDLTDRVSMLESAKECLQQIFTQVYDVSGITIHNRPLILFFGVRASDYLPTIVKDTFFSGSELVALRKTFQDRQPIFLAPHFQPELIPFVDGFYPWILPFGSEVPANSPYDKIGDQKAQQEHLRHFYSHAKKLNQQNSNKFFMAGVWPGFDDHKGRAWGEDLARYVPRDEGAMLDLTWKMALASGAQIILQITWNDWIESTIIEPSFELGYSELEATQQNIAHWKQQFPQPIHLKQPEAIYRCHQQLNDLSAAGAPSQQIILLKNKLKKATLAFSHTLPNPIDIALDMQSIQSSIQNMKDRLIIQSFIFQGTIDDPRSDFLFHTHERGLAIQLKTHQRAIIPSGFWQGRLTLVLQDSGNHFVSIRQSEKSEINPAIELANFRLQNTSQMITLQTDIRTSSLSNAPSNIWFFLFSEKPILYQSASLHLQVSEFSSAD